MNKNAIIFAVFILLTSIFSKLAWATSNGSYLLIYFLVSGLFILFWVHVFEKHNYKIFGDFWKKKDETWKDKANRNIMIDKEVGYLDGLFLVTLIGGIGVFCLGVYGFFVEWISLAISIFLIIIGLIVITFMISSKKSMDKWSKEN
jgi:hypothetical protein